MKEIKIPTQELLDKFTSLEVSFVGISYSKTSQTKILLEGTSKKGEKVHIIMPIESLPTYEATEEYNYLNSHNRFIVGDLSPSFIAVYPPFTPENHHYFVGS